MSCRASTSLSCSVLASEFCLTPAVSDLMPQRWLSGRLSLSEPRQSGKGACAEADQCLS